MTVWVVENGSSEELENVRTATVREKKNSREALFCRVAALLAASAGAAAPEAAVPLEARAALEALAAGGAGEVGGGPAVDPLVVVQDAGQAEGLATRQAHVLLLLRVDARVVAQRHGVGEGLGAEGAAEVARLVGVLVVEQRAGVPVAAAAEIALERPLLLRPRLPVVAASASGRGITAGVGC